MAVAYLWFNAALYLVFGLLCTLKQAKVSNAQGFLALNNDGRCEYLAVYGGMEIGFAAFYALCALKPGMRAAGILFSLCMYAGIVVWRMTSIIRMSDIGRTAKCLAGLEIALLVGAAILFVPFVD